MRESYYERVCGIVPFNDAAEKYPIKDNMSDCNEKIRSGHGHLYYNSSSKLLRKNVAIYGTDDDRTALLYDTDPLVKRAIVKYGNRTHHKILVNDVNAAVRSDVAKYADIDIATSLLSDTHVTIIRTLIQRGEPQHIEYYRSIDNPIVNRLLQDRDDKEIFRILATIRRRATIVENINHPDWRVRYAIANLERVKYFPALIDDPDWRVRERIATYGRDSDLDILVYDSDSRVREAVALHGRRKHLDILINDTEQSVINAVLKFGRESNAETARLNKI